MLASGAAPSAYLICALALVLVTCPASPLHAQPALPSQREIVRAAMRQRPDDLWPRSAAHVILAVPGSQQPEKAYHEPGGSFSPAVPSFGVAIWVRDANGRIQTASDRIELARIQQRFAWPDPAGVPAIATKTPHYAAEWSSGAEGTWLLKLTAEGTGPESLEVVIRSVGPAGGPIESLVWDGTRLRINDRWTVTMQPRPKAVHLGHEGDADWKSAPAPRDRWKGEDGWGYARIEFAKGEAVRMTLRDDKPAQANPLKYPAVRSTIEMELPDPRFAECLHAQTAHLMMGLMDRRTPPGEPTNYPLAWQRDGATVIAALARAGQHQVVKDLARYFAENDFFGGFGAEGDAPGQGARVLEEVAVRVRDPEFDQWLWPHVQRKVELIQRMLKTDRPLRMPFVGPIVPAHRGRADVDLVCEPAKNGLINGRMDWGRPVLYINAVSYQGLRAAAALADRLKHAPEAAQWRQEAAQLQQAWLRAFQTPLSGEQRTYIVALWPSGIAAPIRPAYAEQLKKRSVLGWSRPWTYFTAAMAHQWVLLDRPAEAWKHLEWFLNQQTSPGLYTWWEGEGEENTFRLWEDVRGWAQPRSVTPHYWTAGEMLALQIDMLAYVDESGPAPVLVIGAGIPKAWLDKPLRVRGVSTSLGLVDWAWNAGKLQVTADVPQRRIRAGSAFGADAQIQVDARP